MKSLHFWTKKQQLYSKQHFTELLASTAQTRKNIHTQEVRTSIPLSLAKRKSISRPEHYFPLKWLGGLVQHTNSDLWKLVRSCEWQLTSQRVCVCVSGSCYSGPRRAHTHTAPRGEGCECEPLPVVCSVEVIMA